MFEAIKTVVLENWQNRKRTWRLANYEMKSQSNATMFGFFWNFLNPALQIFVYWFVFAIGLNTGAPQGNYPYIIWMIVGIMPWFYISACLTTSTGSIVAYSGVLKRLYLPLSIVPVKTIIAQFMIHFWAMIVVFVIIFCSGYGVSPYVFELPYYMFASLAFLVGFALLASAINVVFRDFQKLLASVVRLLFYITPVVWVQDRLPEGIRAVLKLNPIAYIVDGYRNCILYGKGISDNWQQAIYFWVVTLVLFIWGSMTHMKFRKQFIDLI